MSILHLLNQTGSLYAPTMGADGNPGYSGSATSVACRVDEDHTQVQNPDGTTVITDAVIFVGPSVTVEVNYRMVIDDYNYRVEKVNPVRGLTAVSHKELLCRRLTDA